MVKAAGCIKSGSINRIPLYKFNVINRKMFNDEDDSFQMFSEREAKSLDLALLWSCEHSIFDYGTFGLWGAFLAGGETGAGQIVAAKNVADDHITDEEFNLLNSKMDNLMLIEYGKVTI